MKGKGKNAKTLTGFAKAELALAYFDFSVGMNFTNYLGRNFLKLSKPQTTLHYRTISSTNLP